jgi:hypothetical protein
MKYSGTFGKNKEAKTAARQLLVTAIEQLDGWALKQSSKAVKGKEKPMPVKPKLIPVTARGKARAKIQKPTAVRYPVKKHVNPPASTITVSYSHPMPGESSQHFAPTPFAGSHSQDARVEVATHASSTAGVNGPSMQDTNTGFNRPPLHPPVLPTPNPSPSPSLSSLVRPSQSQASTASQPPYAQPTAATQAYIDLTGDKAIDIKPEILAAAVSQVFLDIDHTIQLTIALSSRALRSARQLRVDFRT